jgi:hypothetical protein
MPVTRRVSNDEQTVNKFIDALTEVDNLEDTINPDGLEALLTTKDDSFAGGRVEFNLAGEPFEIKFREDYIEFTVPKHLSIEGLPGRIHRSQEVNIVQLNILFAMLLFRSRLSKNQQVIAISFLITVMTAATPEEYSILFDPLYYIAVAEWLIDAVNEDEY